MKFCAVSWLCKEAMMNRLFVLLLLLAFFCQAPYAQQRKRTQKKKPATTAVQQQKKKKTKKSAQATTNTGKKKKKGKKPAAPAGPSIKGLQNERQQLQRQIREQEQRLRKNEKDVKARLENLMVLNTEIADKKRSIETMKLDLSHLNDTIVGLDRQQTLLQEQLDQHKREYIKSLRYMHRNRSMQSKLMFILSAKNFTQMYRRALFLRHYASYQRTQGEAVIQKKAELTRVQGALLAAKDKKDQLLKRDITTHQELETTQTEQQKVVTSLQKEHKNIEALIAEQRKRDAALNAQIDKLIAEEVARAKARAEAEAKRKAEAEAARKRREELARKKAEAERIERENRRRIEEARKKEERLKAEARAAEKRERREAERRAREAERERLAAERKAAEERRAHEREMAAAKRETEAVANYNTEDRALTGNFENNRGRLPMPVVGSYQVVNSFGQYNVEGLHGVRLDSKGVNLKSQPGAGVRSIFNGEVSMVFNASGITGVIIRHGSYFSVYGNLGSVSVSRGQTVSTGQIIGSVGSGGILQFQLRKGKAPLNPLGWLRR